MAARPAYAEERRSPPPTEELRNFANAFQILLTDALASSGDVELVHAAIRGMLAEVDPEGEFFSGEEYKALYAPSRDDGSTGLELARRGSVVVVSWIAPGSPAERAGIRLGDMFEAVDSREVGLRGPELISGWLRGPLGSTVAVRLRHEPAGPASTVRMERVRLPALTTSIDRVGNDVVLRVPRFDEGTPEEAGRLLGDEWRRAPFRGIVLDLRRCPGGLLDASIAMAALFLPRGTTVGTVISREPARNMKFLADPSQYAKNAQGDPFRDVPDLARKATLVVLVDEGTASGGEIVAAAFRDHGRARIVGRHTFGRGSIQSVRRLSSTTALKLTTGHWQTPAGTRFHGVGLEPDVRVEADDPQRVLQTAISEIAR